MDDEHLESLAAEDGEAPSEDVGHTFDWMSPSSRASRLQELEDELRKRNVEIEERRKRALAEAEKALKDHETRGRGSSGRLFEDTTSLSTESREVASSPVAFSMPAAPLSSSRRHLDFSPSAAAVSSQRRSKPTSAGSDDEKTRTQGTDVLTEEGSEKKKRSDGEAELKKAIEDIPPDAALRLQTARLEALREQLEDSLRQLHLKDDVLQQADLRRKDAEEQLARVTRERAALEESTEKWKKQCDERLREVGELKQKAEESEKEIESLRRNTKKMESDGATKEVRLHRAMEEAEKFRSLLRQAHSEGQDVCDGQRQTIEKLSAEVKRLERQKSELIAAFKLQLRLIDVLRRQKAHIEAARLLGFTEEEFTRALEAGSSV